jgi:uncharacterized phage protein gp47/JayE
MASSYPVPSLQESEELLVAIFRALFPDRNVGARRAYHRRKLQVLAAALTELHAHHETVADDVMPDSATGTFAERWGKLFGIQRKGATPARKSAALLVRGDVGEDVPIDAELKHIESGLLFKVEAGATIPAEEEVLVDIVAISTGSKTRLEKGQILEFVSVPDGLQTQAELQLDLDEGGDDIEQESAFKRRYLTAMAEAAAGGNDSDYIKWMTALLGVDDAFVYGNRAGRGTVDVIALRSASGEDRILTEGEADVVIAALRELAPTQVAATGGSLRHLTAAPDPQNVEILVTPNGAAEWAMDWNDETPPEIDSWDSGTMVLTFTVDRPDSMKAGDRICIHGVSSQQTGEVLVIESLVGDDAVKLEEAPEFEPVATDIVYAGGPLTKPIRDALLAHISGEIVYCGPDRRPLPASVADEENTSVFELEVLAEGIGPANPDGKWGTWSGGLIRSVLEGIATYARGVRNATCEVPAADYEATDFAFPDDEQIGLIVPSELLVRRAW